MHQMTPVARLATDEQLIAANQDAADFYRRQLLGPEGRQPRRYLIGRGFEAVLEDTGFGVGYAPAQWTALSDDLAQLGYSNAVIREAGLAKRSQSGRMIDTFRDRITFTITNPAGQAIGFTGRCGPNATSMTPKYLNTRSTPIYDKSRALFFAGAATAQPANLVVAEGPLDAIAVELATDHESLAVATCGTAFTPTHAQILTALNPGRVTLAYDADTPGLTAMVNTCGHLSEIDDVRAIRLRVGADPAQVLADHGPALLAVIVAAARPAGDAIVDHHIRTWRADQRGAEANLCLLREILGDVRPMPAGDVAHQVGRVATLLGFDHQTVTRELLNAPSREVTRTTKRPETARWPMSVPPFTVNRGPTYGR